MLVISCVCCWDLECMELYLRFPSPLHGMKFKRVVFIVWDPVLSSGHCWSISPHSPSFYWHFIIFLYRYGIIAFTILRVCISQQFMVSNNTTISVKCVRDACGMDTNSNKILVADSFKKSGNKFWCPLGKLKLYHCRRYPVSSLTTGVPLVLLWDTKLRC
jgi:hypothetical protein